ncbi:hypothetical protein [Streptomyces sp. NBC_01334]|uniref:hypothetical protein n=1 Tax=Streptomyces sp. NBC_01334 TaxID=2903827 RepID=UPI002E0EB6C3|nr:hypothetical protein OG736_44575 [Streptomyces sp. NBC_01334]
METTANASETAPTSHAPDPDVLTPGQLLRQAKRLADEAARLLEQAVVAERIRGTSWDTIGEVLGGVTKSAVQKRYGTFVTEWIEHNVDFEDAPDGSPRQLPLFPDAYEALWTKWKRAADIIAAQDVIAELANATTAVSGEGPIRAADADVTRAPLLVPRQAAVHATPSWFPDTSEGWDAVVARAADYRQHLMTPWRRDHMAARTRSLDTERVDQGDNPHALSALEQRVATLEEFFAKVIQDEEVFTDVLRRKFSPVHREPSESEDNEDADAPEVLYRGSF